METFRIRSIQPEMGVRASRSAPVMIATDGKTQSDAALAVGRIFAGEPEAMRVVTVLPGMPAVAEPPIAMPPDFEALRRADVQRAVIGQMTRVWGTLADVDIRSGDPASTMARLAHQSNATMIVSGLGRHRVADRIFGTETALRLIRLADVPVFAAAAGMSRAPQRIVVACDFSETSLRAARIAIELAAPNATLYLAHVASRHEQIGWSRAYMEDAGAVDRTREQLRPPRDMAVQVIHLEGDVATELLAFAVSVNADLIATGSHGHGFVARMLIGSVATRIVRGSNCSVLTVPHAAVTTDVRTAVASPLGLTIPKADWERALNELSRRNHGRRSSLEVDDPEMGAQAQVSDYPLLGAAFDRHDQRVELMFGDAKMQGHHFTRGIGGVTSIDLLRDERGRDIALRIAHGFGQTLLTFSASD